MLCHPLATRPKRKHRDTPRTRRGANHTRTWAFTLIELSIVLVIIGLIVGGVLVGQDLIRASEVRAEVTQIEKFNTAVNAFYGKYGGLPGDLNSTSATQFGFAVGTGCDASNLGKRNGDGLLQGWPPGSATIYSQTVGETALFWEDLSDVRLIDGKFPNGVTSQTDANGNNIFNCSGALTLSATQLGNYFPSAKIGYGNSVYVYGDGVRNWFGIEQITSVASFGGTPTATPDIPVRQAYSIDSKIDDGNPVTGRVIANYIVLSSAPTTVLLPAPNTATSGGNASSCYDTTTNTYSITQSNGAGANCAISIRMQSGD